MNKEPRNETYLAAELAQVMPPVRAARVALELCSIGRSYKTVAGRLCGGESEWGAWSDKVGKAQERAYTANARRITKARALVAGWPVRIEVEGLFMKAFTIKGRGMSAHKYGTALL